MTVINIALLFLAGMLASALNSVAGGGSFISFPLLLFMGIPPINANTTSTVALWPGSVASTSAYREKLTGDRRELILLIVASLAGGIVGALILLNTSQEAFGRIVPFLLLVATLLLASSQRITRFARSRKLGSSMSPGTTLTVVLVLQFFIAVYGGFFGGGMGIIMLAIMSLRGMEDIHEMNSIKIMLAAVVNGLAVAIFVISGRVYWPQGIVLMAGAIVGGYTGAFYAQRLPSERVRSFIIGVGVFMTIYFFIRTYAPIG